ncbi:PIN domain-containing protein [Cellulomonas sp. WB94]|uniref:PIN domain-containing protein n=1 Tax=Cellulomonas sp. WB94 TaxID=2173174 RepID=UPI001F5B9109|nr:PIN domain-containing protein [Cellulomonas sp. WB94]
MRIYVDGSALCRYLLDTDEAAAWRSWVATREPSLLTSPLALTELRRVADRGGPRLRAAAHDVAERLEIVRFSDQSLEWATRVTSVLSPFGALHLGIAVAHPDVATVATYDARLAAVAALHGLEVVTPGRPEGWWDRS